MSADPVGGVSPATRPPLRVTGLASARAAAAAPSPPPPPPPSLASQGLRLDADSSLAAARDFAAGAVVLLDAQPLLVAPALRPSHAASKILEGTYFQRTHIPASVVLKLAAFLCAASNTAERLAALPCPPLDDDGGDGESGSGATAAATHPLAAQARAFAAKLRADPPPALPAGTVEGWPPADVAAGPALEARWRALWEDERRTARAWVVWSLGARPAPGGAGSALGAGPAALEHVCRGANTMYVPPPAGGGVREAASASAGHVALRPIKGGEPLTTCYLGTGRGALLATAPERQRRLEDDFLRRGARGGGCGCASCRAGAPDAARGLPCPDCSAPFRGQDRLLTPEAARVAAAELGGGDGDGPSGSGDGDKTTNRNQERKKLGYIYRAGGGGNGTGVGAEWACDQCGRAFPDDTAEVLGRHYRTHATIEGDMSALARRVDASLDEQGPLVSDVGALAARVEGVARLLGPRHAAVWRLRLAQAECHAGEAERLLAGLGPAAGGGGGRMAAALGEVRAALDCLDRVWDAVRAAPFEKEGVVLAADVLSAAPGEEAENEGEGEGGGSPDAAAEATKKAEATEAGATAEATTTARREGVAAESLAHHAVELCALAREACALAASSPSEAGATAGRRRELSARAAAWLERVEGAVRGVQRVRGGRGRDAGAPSAAAAERSDAQVREIVGNLQRMAAKEGV